MEEQLRILMLEDNINDAELLEHTLRKGGIHFTVRRVQDRASFLSALKDFMPDLVLADYSLPSFTGLEAVDIIRRHYEKIPIILVTGSLNEETAVDCIKAGAWDYVIKENILRLVPAVQGTLKLKETFDEKRKAEEVLRNSAREWQTTFDAINDAVSLLDPKGRIVRCNRAAESLFGKETDQILGHTCWELFKQNFTPPEFCPFDRMLKSGKRETYVLQRQGRWYKETLDPVLDRSGNVISAVQVHADITDQKQYEKNIQEERDRAQQFLDIAGVTILILDAGGKVKLINRKGCEILGYEESEVVGKNWFEHFVPDRERFRVNDIFEGMRKRDIHEYEENFIVSKSGEERLVAWHNSRWVDEQGVFLGTLSSGEDITERKKIEEQVKFLARFPSESPSPVLRVLADGTIIYSNEASAPLLREWGCAVGQGLPEQLRRVVSDAMRTGERVAHEIASGGKTFSFLITPIKGEGYVNLYGADITDRLVAENSLANERNMLRTLVDSLPDIISIKDGNGRFLLANKTLSDLYGESDPMSLIGSTDFDFVADDMAARYFEDERELIRTGKKIINKEETVADHTGKIRYVLTTKVPFIGGTSGNISGVVVIARDITEKKMFQEELEQKEKQLQQAQKMEAVGRLAGGIAHDFNNVLTAIIGYADYMLMKLDKNDRFREYVQEIRKAGTRAANLTHQLLAFSRRQVVQPKILNLNTILHDIEKMLRQLLGEDIHIKMELERELDAIKMDESQIEQVVMNLAVNARDAMPEGGLLTIRTCNAVLDESYCKNHSGVEPGRYAMLMVSDSGVGMDRETQLRVFEPFFTTKEIGKGTGLGLSTAYGIVKQSGGHIWLYSERGKGTAFKIYLPAVTEESVKEGEGETFTGSLEGSESILLVEDEEMVMNICKEVLETYGYSVIATNDAKKALKTLEEGKESIDLLITDMVMPAMNGNELADSARAVKPGLKVIYISGFQEHVLFNTAAQERFIFLEKPFMPIELVRKVRSVLDNRHD